MEEAMERNRSVVESAGNTSSAAELPKPLFVQIREYIAELIISGKLEPESKIASERELSRDLDVSRMTVRRAITELVEEGLLVRRHGSGTYVAKPKITYDVAELVSYDQALVSRGLKVTRQLLEFSEVPASRRLAEQMQVDVGHPLYRVVLLILANRVPIIVEQSFFSCDRCPDLYEFDLERTSVYDLLLQRYKVNIGDTEHEIEVVEAAETTAKQLRVDEGFPLLRITRTVHRAEDGKSVQYSQDLLRSDYVRMHLRQCPADLAKSGSIPDPIYSKGPSDDSHTSPEAKDHQKGGQEAGIFVTGPDAS
jgi:GntR family transcriptional regulator